MRKTLIINYRQLLVGGIENIVISIMKNSLDAGHRVIWMCDTSPKIADVYFDFLKNQRIERIPCDTHGYHWFKHGQTDIEAEERVTILSFNFFDQTRALQLKKKLHCKSIKALYLIPHFTGGLVFPEQLFNNSIKIRNRAAFLYQNWIDSGLLVFCGKRHISALQESYGVMISDEKQLLIPALQERLPFNEEQVKERYRRNEFRIVSASRLEFPHKGFMVGLLRAFISLKENHPRLTLYLIGDGNGDKQLKEIISESSESIVKDVHLLGSMRFEKLAEFYQTCNLSVSVAGCLILGAKVGLLSLPARHYTYDCEVYGFTPSAKNMTLESKPGHDVREYIEKAINMSEDEYVKCCRDTYNSYETQPIDKDFFFNLKGVNEAYNISIRDFLAVKCIYYAHKLDFILNRSKHGQ